MAEYRKFLPKPTPETQEYWDALGHDRFILQRCKMCKRVYYYPRSFCPQLDCHSREVESFQASGRGTIYSFVINTRPPQGFEDEVPYFIAVVELEEGPRLMTNLIDVPGTDVETKAANVRVGDPIEIVFDHVTDSITLPKCRLVTAP